MGGVFNTAFVFSLSLAYVSSKNKGACNQSKTTSNAPSQGQHCCQVCGWRFKKLSVFSNHLRIHTKAKPFVCFRCNKAFRQNTTLTRHYKSTRHLFSGIRLVNMSYIDERILRCADCPQAFSHGNELLHHRKIMHPINFGLNTCLRCGRPFLSMFNATHRCSKLIRCKCNQCGRTFTQWKGLREHEVVHTGMRIFQCPTCLRNFSFRSSLFRHTKSKTCSKRLHAKAKMELSALQSSDYKPREDQVKIPRLGTQ
mmetsp:Transcript_17188/g.32725  ORF Transcript_17188/g.32725 Transcript_17188/m.32725 type:complete len:254 (-) Transcript_17188:27-788(-)